MSIELSTAGASISEPDVATMRAANVNPETRLATDYLNLFNEYVMLAELFEDGSLDDEMIQEWQPVDYEDHFHQSNFAATDVVILAFRSLPDDDRADFEEAVGALVDLILAHRSKVHIASVTLDDIKHQRDFVAALINGTHGAAILDSSAKQADIDAFLDDDYVNDEAEVCPLTSA